MTEQKGSAQALLLLSADVTVHPGADHEQLTDLVTVFTGFGVFTASSRIRSRAGHEGLTDSRSIQRLGYLSQPMVSYALALFAWIRGERDPSWRTGARDPAGRSSAVTCQAPGPRPGTIPRWPPGS